MKKWGLTTIVALAAVGVLGACGTSEAKESSKASDQKVKEEVVGVAPGPYGDMATDVISPLLEEKGYKLTTKVFNDYVQPNKALASGQIDADLFQHTAYLEKFASDNDLDLTVVQQIPTLGMGIYSNKLESLDEVKEGTTVSLANDASNLARTLQLLEDNELITIKGDVDQTKATLDDIDENPKHLEFKPLEAAQLTRSLDTVDLALVPGNFSWAAELDPADALALEDLTEEYKNVFVVNTKDKDSDFSQAVAEVLESQEFKDAIAESEFKDFSKPAFWTE
ncbi:MAG: MetQ/NlpA family ABC transporter substrate-binding protein [Enterococcus sp.]